jgi:signal transduction histidine kinase
MEYEMHPIQITAMVRSVAEEFEVQAQEKKIRLEIDAEPEVWAECDRDRITQVLGNLFENALKFAPEGSSIVAQIVKKNGKVLVSMTDSGPGVPEQHKKKIFEKFHQVKQGRKIAGQGVGLGLAICKTIIEAHNGEIWVEDNPSGGSVFCFVLNVAVPAAVAADAASVAGHSA